MVLGTVKSVNIEDEMRNSYLNYAMSVIVARALPDVRDGLKPVQRRILYAMGEMGIVHNSPYKKSARIVGEVLGKYHPHGDVSVYEAMVRMAQDFSMRYVLIDGQGNFGSMDDDPPAAMRYTEARLAQIAEQMLVDIDKETVDFVPNFDDSLKEPSVLPTKLPNLLVNGSSGIAVGMATNIPPHNLGEICDAISYLIGHSEASVDELMRFVKGPDFPTAGIILGQEGIRNAYATGHGKVVVRAKAEITEMPNSTERSQIVVTELPYQTNKAALMEKIAELAREKKIPGIGEVRDESDRQGMRIVIELKKEAQPLQVLNNLYKRTEMQSVIFINMLALVDGQPRVISLREALQHFIDFRRVVITRRSQFELSKAKARAHILEGLKIALDNLDRVIAIIRSSENAEKARTNLMTKFGLSQLQAQAILDMQLRRLASLERQAILEEYAAVLKTIADLEDLLANPRRIYHLIKAEAGELKSKYGDRRSTRISREEAKEFGEEDLIPHQSDVVMLSKNGYIKKMPLHIFKSRQRAGGGIMAMVTREEDAVRLLTMADSHDTLLFFTDRGKVYSIKCHGVPEDISRIGRGLPIVNLLPILSTEKVTALVAVSEFKPNTYMVMATRRGVVKKIPLDTFASVRRKGLIVMYLETGDEMVSLGLAKADDEVILVTRQGQSIRFGMDSVLDGSRTDGGVPGIQLSPGDQVVSMDVVRPDTYVLLVTKNGVGKLTSIDDYPRQDRGGTGLMTLQVTDEVGEVAAAKHVSLSEVLMIISAEGNIIPIPVKEEHPGQGIPITGRSGQGVRVMQLRSGDSVVAIACFEADVKPTEEPEAA